MKFKVWDSDLKMFIGSSKYFINHEGILYFDYWNHCGPAPKRASVVYSTGATGKDEVELFGGDIVKASIYEGEDEQILEVKCIKGVFVIEYDDGDFESFLVVDFPGIIEKIGTKLENPELLEKGNP